MPRGVPGSGPKPKTPTRARGRGRGQGISATSARIIDASEVVSETPIDESVTAADIYYGRVNIDDPSTSSSTVLESDKPVSPDNEDQEMPDAPTPPVQSIETPQEAHPTPQAAPEISRWTAVNTSVAPNASASSPPAVASSSSATATAARPAPVARISALKAHSAASPARSVSPIMSSTRGGKKVLKHQPVFKGRKSQETRDARHAEAAAKERQRKAAQQAEDNAAAATALRKAGWGSRGGDRGRGRGRGRGASYMGDRGPAPIGVAGPFSAVNTESRRFLQRARLDERSKIKQEDPSNPSIALDGEIIDGGYISSDPDDEQQGPRFNVDAINALLESDTDTPHPSFSSASRPKRRAMSNYAPVRLTRLEHKDRVMGINTEASAAPAGARGRTATATVKGEPGPSGISPTQRKSKPKAVADVEVISSRQFKGVWTDSSSDEAPSIKPDPDATTQPRPSSPVAKVKSPSLSPSRLRKPTRRRSSYNATLAPALQTEEERQEWSRHMFDLHTIREELGNMNTSGDANDSTVEDKKKDRVYLFQLPPVMPSLFPKDEKGKGKEKEKEKDKEKAVHFEDGTLPDAPPGPSSASQPLTQPASTPVPPKEEPNHLKPTFTPGHAGTLRIHASGRASLSWGGTAFSVSMGMEATFLEDVVVVRRHPERVKTESEENDVKKGKEGLAEAMARKAREDDERERKERGGYGGEALGFGQVRGKFVVSPDWGEIVG